jgi:hypothetical protein
VSVIEIFVTDQVTGQPLAGADVGLFLVERVPPGREQEAGAELHRSVTDSLGISMIRVEVPPGARYRVVTFVRSHGHAEWRPRAFGPTVGHPLQAESEVTLGVGETLRIDASLERGTTLRGRVVDPLGQPVADAHIGLVLSLPTACSWPYATGVARNAHWPPPVRTDAHGEFEWLSFPLHQVRADPSAHYVLLVDHESHAPAMVHRVEAIAPNEKGVVELRIRLEPGAVLRGRVLGVTGSPLQGATVTATAAPLPDQPVCVRNDRSAETDAAGHFQFRGLLRTAHTVTAEAPGHAPWSGDIDLVAGSGALPDIHLGRGTDLVGRVEDRDGAPIPDVDVYALMQEARVARRTRSDARGEFRLAGLPASGRVEVRCSLFAVMEVDLPSPPITLRTPPRADLHVTLIADETGLPIVDAGFVTALGPGFSALLERGPGGTLQRLQTSVGKYDLRADVPERATASATVVLPEQGLEGPVVIRVPQGGAARGRVSDARGGPLGGIRVSAFAPRGLYPREATTDGTGMYEVRGLASKAYVVFSGQGLALNAVRLGNTGQPGSPVTLDVTMGVGATVLGRLTRLDGGPVGRTSVRVSFADGRQVPFELPSTLCDDEGRFELHHVPEGEFVVTANLARSTLRATHGSVHQVSMQLA